MLSRLEKAIGLCYHLLPPQKLYATLLGVGYCRESIIFKTVRHCYTHHKLLLIKSFPQGFIFHHGEFANEYLGKIWINYILVCFHCSWKVFSSHGLQ